MEKSELQKKYENRRNYVSQLDLYNITKKNGDYYSGKHYEGKKVPAKYPKSVFNIIRRIADFKVSSVMAENVKYNFEVEGVEENSENLQTYERAIEIFNALADKTTDDLIIKDKNEKVLRKACLSGSGVIHFYWDNDKKGGNDVKYIGDIEAEIIPAVNVYPSNANISDVQKQSDIIITCRKLVKDVKEEGKKNGVSDVELQRIVKDSDTEFTDSYNSKFESNGEDKTTVLYYYYKKNGTVWFRKESCGVIIKPDVDTQKKLFPIAKMDWLDSDSTFYGGTEITEIVANQDIINSTISAAAVSVQKTAFPKAVYDKNRIAGYTSAVGVAIPVNGDVSGAITFPEVGNLSSDAWSLATTVMDWTKDLLGANESALGEAKADNTSALLTQIRQASVPIEGIKRRYFKYLKDIALIWIDYWTNNYNTMRLIKLKSEQQDQMVKYTGTDYKDIEFSVKVDVGGASAWSESLELTLLNDLLAQGKITDIEYFERIPNYMLSKKEELIKSRKDQMEQQQQMQQDNQSFIQQLPPEVQAQLAQMPEEQRNAEINAMMGMI